MEPSETAATQTFRSQAEVIMELAVESAVSVLQQRLGQEETDSEKRLVGNKWLVHTYTRVVEQQEFKNTGFETSRGKSHRHFRFCPRPLTRETRMSVYLFEKTK